MEPKNIFSLANKQFYKELEIKRAAELERMRPLFYIEEVERQEADGNIRQEYFSTHYELKSFNKYYLLEDKDYSNDIEDILKVQYSLFKIENRKFTLDQSAKIWQNYSWNLAASWLFVGDTPEDIVRSIRSDDFFTSYDEILTQP